MLPQNEQSDTSFFIFFYNHIMSSKHHVGVQYVYSIVITTDRHSELRNFLLILKKAAFYSA